MDSTGIQFTTQLQHCVSADLQLLLIYIVTSRGLFPNILELTKIVVLQVLTKETKINFLKTVGQPVPFQQSACGVCFTPPTFDILHILDYYWQQTQSCTEIVLLCTIYHICLDLALDTKTEHYDWAVSVELKKSVCR
jgi:hypothetical protein